MSSKEKTSEIGWLATQQSGFGTVTAADDFLHPDVQLPDFTLTETYWFNFYVPERGLSGAIYCWMHKNLGSCTSGVWIYRGFKAHHLQCEHFNVQSHLPYPQQQGNTITVPHIGLQIEIVEPLKRHAIRYRDPHSDTRLDLDVSALMPPAVRGNGFHFEQAIQVKGSLTLAGEHIVVDSFSVRDRSWGQARAEDPARHPPLDWAVGVLDGGRTAFNILACDDPEAHSGWTQRYGITRDRTLRDGWLYQDGRLRHIVSATQLVEREAGGMRRPLGYRCDFEVEGGSRHSLVGRLVGQCPFGLWPNLYSTFSMVEWDLDGRKGWGDLQDSYWIEFLRP